MTPEFQLMLDRFSAAFGPQCAAAYASAGLSYEQARAMHDEHIAAVKRLAAQPQPTGAAKFAAGMKLPK